MVNKLDFRSGQPVLFDLSPEFSASTVAKLREDLYQSKDGSFVGIYEKAGEAPNANADIDGQPARLPIEEAISPMKADGCNLRIPDPSGEPVFVQVKFKPEQVRNVRALLDRADMPPGRVLAPDWQPRP